MLYTLLAITPLAMLWTCYLLPLRIITYDSIHALPLER